MFTEVQLHKNILFLTNYKKQDNDKRAVSGTRAPNSA